jgi:hypothetical protein
MIDLIFLSDIKLNLIVCKQSNEEVPASCNQMTKLCDVDSVVVKGVFCCFGVYHEIDIIKLHITKPLQGMKQS